MRITLDILKKLMSIVVETVYFYFLILKIIVVDRCFMSGLILLLVAPYVLSVNAIMKFVPQEYQDKVLPFVYTMQ